MSQPLPYVQIKVIRNVKLEHTLITPDDSDIDCFVEFDLNYPDKLKEKTRYFLFCPENKYKDLDKFIVYKNEIKPKDFTRNGQLICDWTDEKN